MLAGNGLRRVSEIETCSRSAFGCLAAGVRHLVIARPGTRCTRPLHQAVVITWLCAGSAPRPRCERSAWSPRTWPRCQTAWGGATRTLAWTCWKVGLLSRCGLMALPGFRALRCGCAMQPWQCTRILRPCSLGVLLARAAGFGSLAWCGRGPCSAKASLTQGCRATEPRSGSWRTDVCLHAPGPACAA